MMDDNTENLNEQIDRIVNSTWDEYNHDDIRTLRWALESAIFYLQAEGDEHRLMIGCLQSALDNTFNPDSDNGTALAA